MAITVVATWLLYVSGIFVLWTPLPLLYRYGRTGKRAYVLCGLIAVGIIFLCYRILLGSEVGIGSGWRSFIALPGLGFREYFSSQAVLIFALVYFLYYAAIAGLLGWAHEAQLSVAKTFGFAVGVPLIMGVLMIGVLASTANFDVVAEIRAYFGHVLDKIALLGPSAGVSERELDFVRTHRDEIAGQIVRMLPAGIVIGTLVTVWCNTMAARHWFPHGGLFSHFGKLARWRLEDRWIWVLLGAATLYFFDYYVLKNGTLGTVAINMLWVGAAVYFLHGLAIVAFFLQQRPSFLLKAIVYGLLILFFQVLAILVAALGVFDVWFDFRKLAGRTG